MDYLSKVIKAAIGRERLPDVPEVDQIDSSKSKRKSLPKVFEAG